MCNRRWALGWTLLVALACSQAGAQQVGGAQAGRYLEVTHGLEVQAGARVWLIADEAYGALSWSEHIGSMLPQGEVVAEGVTDSLGRFVVPSDVELNRSLAVIARYDGLIGVGRTTVIDRERGSAPTGGEVVRVPLRDFKERVVRVIDEQGAPIKGALVARGYEADLRWQGCTGGRMGGPHDELALTNERGEIIWLGARHLGARRYARDFLIAVVRPDGTAEIRELNKYDVADVETLRVRRGRALTLVVAPELESREVELSWIRKWRPNDDRRTLTSGPNWLNVVAGRPLVLSGFEPGAEVSFTVSAFNHDPRTTSFVVTAGGEEPVILAAGEPWGELTLRLNPPPPEDWNGSLRFEIERDSSYPQAYGARTAPDGSHTIACPAGRELTLRVVALSAWIPDVRQSRCQAAQLSVSALAPRERRDLGVVPMALSADVLRSRRKPAGEPTPCGTISGRIKIATPGVERELLIIVSRPPAIPWFGGTDTDGRFRVDGRQVGNHSVEIRRAFSSNILMRPRILPLVAVEASSTTDLGEIMLGEDLVRHDYLVTDSVGRPVRGEMFQVSAHAKNQLVAAGDIETDGFGRLVFWAPQGSEWRARHWGLGDTEFQSQRLERTDEKTLRVLRVDER